MYTVREYGMMLADRRRMDAYEEALRRTVGPDTVVLDIGTGPGIVALLAAQMGARKVYAIEPAPIVNLGPEIARANGLADRIEFIQARSEDVVLPEKADVVVFDLRGVLPVGSRALATVLDARERLLAPGGALLPARDDLYAAVVQDAGVYSSAIGAWDDLPYDLDLAAVRRYAVHGWRRVDLDPEGLLTDGRRWTVLDYTAVDRRDGFVGDVRWKIERPGVGHGITLWFETTLVPGIGYSSGPGGRTVYGQAFLPFEVPLVLEEGESLHLTLRMKVVQGLDVWVWETDVSGPDGEVRSTARQSTALSIPLSPQALRRSRSDHVPTLSPEGVVDRFILHQMEGSTLGAIAERVHQEFPDRFQSPIEALGRVSQLSQQYGAD